MGFCIFSTADGTADPSELLIRALDPDIDVFFSLSISLFCLTVLESESEEKK